MTVQNIEEAGRNLPRLVQLALQGEEVFIVEGGRQLRLTPVPKTEPEPREPRKPGDMEGQIWIADDFDELPDDLLAAFEGE